MLKVEKETIKSIKKVEKETIPLLPKVALEKIKSSRWERRR